MPVLSENMTIDYDEKIILKSLENTLNQLSDKDRQVYTLRIEQELSLKEISTILHIPEGSVKSSLFYTLKKISKQLESLIHE